MLMVWRRRRKGWRLKEQGGVHLLNHAFSVFNQYYPYFYTIFYPHVKSVWQPYLNTKLHLLNNITYIFTHFFIHTYIKNTQTNSPTRLVFSHMLSNNKTRVFKHMYQTSRYMVYPAYMPGTPYNFQYQTPLKG